MPMAAAAMTMVAVQPMILSGPEILNFPMIFELATISIIMAMTGTAVTPLITALQKRARIGLIGEKLMATPTVVASAIVA